ncbi:hypothetical protein DTO271G3_3724 [Paecilomyces variotii]|nr:hypothetical protein DTO271G3_3724 [Paecilomyces variotii]
MIVTTPAARNWASALTMNRIPGPVSTSALGSSPNILASGRMAGHGEPSGRQADEFVKTSSPASLGPEHPALESTSNYVSDAAMYALSLQASNGQMRCTVTRW